MPLLTYGNHPGMVTQQIFSKKILSKAKNDMLSAFEAGQSTPVKDPALLYDSNTMIAGTGNSFRIAVYRLLLNLHQTLRDRRLSSGRQIRKYNR